MVVIVPLPYIYNMTNLSKNKKRFLKALGLRPAPQENVMKLFSPSCGLIYNMLKNSKSVTLFVIFFKDFLSPLLLSSFASSSHGIVSGTL